MIKLGNAQDRKSSYSTRPDSNCVVVGSDRPDSVRVRDSKIPDSELVRVSPDAFAAFTRSL